MIFSLNKYLIWYLKKYGKKDSKRFWNYLLQARSLAKVFKNKDYLFQPDIFNGKLAVIENGRLTIDGFPIREEWCIK